MTSKSESIEPEIVGTRRGPKLKGPVTEDDFDTVENLFKMQCTLEEIAGFYSVDVKTIQSRVEEWYGMKFSQIAELKRGSGKVSLRRAQMQKALSGSVPMLIWLGKQYLGQRDKYESVGSDEDSLENTSLEKIENEIANRQGRFASVRLKTRSPEDFEKSLIVVSGKTEKK